MARDGYGYRKVARAHKELAELDSADNHSKVCNLAGMFTVTFSHGVGDNYSVLRVNVRCVSKAQALYRALELPEVAKWLPEHPDANSTVATAKLIVNKP